MKAKVEEMKEVVALLAKTEEEVFLKKKILTNMQLQIFRGKKKIKTWQNWRRSWTQPGINWQRCGDVRWGDGRWGDGGGEMGGGELWGGEADRKIASACNVCVLIKDNSM